MTDIEKIKQFVLSDSIAISYQSTKQYVIEFLSLLANIKDIKVSLPLIMVDWEGRNIAEYRAQLLKIIKEIENK